MSSLRLRILRFLLKQGVNPWLKSYLKRPSLHTLEIPLTEQALIQKRAKRFWIHGASVGELESLWTLIELLLQKNVEVIVTGFSGSSEKHLKRLNESFKSKASGFLGAYYSPLDGDWEKWLIDLRPDAFITAKYEAWPELWASLAQEKIPLFIVGAKARSSVLLARRLLQWLGAKLPEVVFLAGNKKDAEKILTTVGFGRVELVGEPRWDRVHQRASATDLRAKQLTGSLKAWAAKPWGVIGSAWLSDLEMLGTSLTEVPGTIWIVPHSLEIQNILEIERFLESIHLPAIRSSWIDETFKGQTFKAKVVLVDEMGFLFELYGSADWAFVGGGFGKGIHSTLEPGYYGIPVGCGPNKTEMFAEVFELQENGQLSVLSQTDQIKKWMQDVTHVSDEQKMNWKKEAVARLGATQKVYSLLAARLSLP